MPINTFDYLKASQSGYAVDYATQGAQGGFPGNFLNQNSQAGYSRFGSGNDFMSQVAEVAINEAFFLNLGCFVLLVLIFPLFFGNSQDYMAHGSQGLFTQVGFSDPLQDDATQSHFNVANANPLQSQVSCSSSVFIIIT